MGAASTLHRHRRFLSGLALIAVLSAAVLVLASRSWIVDAARGRIASAPSQAAPCPTALVLGCGRVLPDGRENLYFHYRMEAAAALYKTGKVRHLIVSGDNSRPDYDEPTEMKMALVELGVPREHIHCDYAGFSTLDSVLRARDIFRQDRILVVSQEFHAQRAIYLARHHGIDAYGLAARDVGSSAGFYTRCRENLARVKAVLDLHVLRSKPKFLGDPISLDA